MMMYTRRTAIAALVTGAIALGPGNAGADVQSSTHVDSLSASAAGGFVQVSGTATFVDVPTLVADEAGDSTSYDVTQATISRVPGSNSLKFTMNLNPNSLPDLPTLTYMWPIAVDGAQEGFWLQASRNSLSTNPGFALNKLGTTGSYTTVATLTGSMTSTKVEWNVPLTRINASPGSTIEQGGAFPGGWVCPVGSTGGATGFYSCGVTFDEVYFENATVPSATVQLGIAPAGTPPESVSLIESATVATNGSFSGAIPAAGLSGSHVVVAKACYAAGVCGLSSTTVTI